MILRLTMRSSIARARLSGALDPAGGTATFEYRFDPDDPTFAGHFPGRPLLPGAFQLEIARVAAEEMLSCPLAIEEVGKAKFLRPISPGETVRVELKVSEGTPLIQARVRFSVGGQPAGETRLSLARRS